MASPSRKGEAFRFSRLPLESTRGGQARLILVTGGARAGKSRFALRLAEEQPFPQRLYVATGVACDQEMRSRIARHRKERDGRWATLEEPVRLPDRLPSRYLRGKSVLLFDCLPTFITNLLLKDVSQEGIRTRIAALVRACGRPGICSIFVTNEVGLGIVPAHPLGRKFRDILGMVNRQVAGRADEVYLLVAGIPLRIK